MTKSQIFRPVCHPLKFWGVLGYTKSMHKHKEIELINTKHDCVGLYYVFKQYIKQSLDRHCGRLTY